MGERGPLRLAPPLADVTAGSVGVEGTAATKVESGRAAPPRGSGTWSTTLRNLWNQVAGQLEDAGLSAEVDGMALELALRHFLAARKASDALLRSEVVVDDPAHGSGVKKNPAGAEMRQQSLAFLEYAKQIGLTFGSRARIPLEPKDGGEGDNPFG